MASQSDVAGFYEVLRYPGPDALVTYIWPNRLAPFVPGGCFTFLDAGCGSGRHTAGMLDIYAHSRAYCTDVSRPSLDEAVALLRAKGFAHRATLQHGSFLDPIFLPEPVDIALAIGTIHHCPDPLRALLNIAAAVKPGGHIACMVYGTRGHQRRYEIKEALGLLTQDSDESERLYRSYQRKYMSLLDRTPRAVMRDAGDRASHWLNRALGRKRYGYKTGQQSSVFLRDAMMSPLDVAFDAFGIRRLVEESGLEIVAMFGLGRHDPSMLPDGWRPYWSRLDFWERTRLSELIDPNPKSWSFIARRLPDCH